MKNYEYYIGVDVSKKTLDVCASKGKEKVFYMRVSNDGDGLKELATYGGYVSHQKFYGIQGLLRSEGRGGQA